MKYILEEAGTSMDKGMETLIIVEQYLNLYNSIWSVQNLRMAREIRNIAKHNNYLSFASDTRESFTSEQSLIGTELEDGEEMGNIAKHNNY